MIFNSCVFRQFQLKLFTILLFIVFFVSGRPRPEVHRGASAPKVSKAGFGSNVAKTPPVTKGFGGSTATPPSEALTLEQTIQNKISSISWLRESMNLQSEIRNFAAATVSLTEIDYALRVTEGVENTMRLKNGRLQVLQEEEGMTREHIHKTLQEITWDASASIRNDRHTQAQIGGKNKEKGRDKKGDAPNLIISDAVNQHMLDIAKWTDRQGDLDAYKCNILDVGCGNGVLAKYLGDYYKGSSQWKEGYIGLDLSSEMVKVAQANHPGCTFLKAEFLAYKPPTLPDQQLFTNVVLNEVLHYFLDVPQALSHAIDMLCPGGRIVISHPKGYENVRLQQSKNRMLVANLLPTTEELEAMDLGKMKVRLELPPNIASDQYLCVLEKTA
jgi:SAM-dependent methyltransferase